MKTGPEQEGNINFWMFHLITFGFPVDPLVYITYITSGGDQHSVVAAAVSSLGFAPSGGRVTASIC